ncbi:hypothetical protein R6V09_37690 [Streptomyces sp. W16]|uniref:hypothetical protein n=1 Tax=Streptomyces sp. W16 TaxID=3076631 RepID=UPI00295AE04B|nr:hypothetical protein [Streptomyces sp. W16]MDV9175838.1 hypothetical protein [Streptomyces sp. W16]
MDDHLDAALRALSWNPATPAGVLLRLLKLDHRDVRRTVAQRAHLPLEVVDAILADPEPRLRQDFADSVSADPAQRARLVDDPSPKVVLALAIGPTPYRGRVEPLPDWAYERLLKNPDERIRHESVLWSVVPAHVLAGLADHPDSVLRRASCRAWEELPDATRELLLRDDDLKVRQAAAVQVCREDADRTAWLVESLGNSWPVDEVLRTGLLSREFAEHMVAQPHPVSVAANPSLPPDLVRQLAVDPDPRIRLVVSARPELTEPERAAIDYTVDPEARLRPLDWVWDAREDVEVLRRCATSAHTWLRRSAAVCPALPPDMVELLARDEDFAVRLLLCEFHPEPPPELLLDLYLYGSHRAVEMLIAKPGFPSAGLAARFLDSPDPRQRRLALRDPALTPEDLDRLSREGLPGLVARDPRLPLARIRELLADPDMLGSVAGNPALPVEDMQRLLDAAGVPD